MLEYYPAKENKSNLDWFDIFFPVFHTLFVGSFRAYEKTQRTEKELSKQ